MDHVIIQLSRALQKAEITKERRAEITDFLERLQGDLLKAKKLADELAINLCSL